MELLLRIPGSTDLTSPFDAALREVAASGAVDLAAPYLSVATLREVIGAAPRFRLVTDAEEWLRAFARPARLDILAFIRQHSAQVRHFRDLHAKVALSHTLAMFGSANFTEMGLHQRQEVGALVRDTNHVAALTTWYSALWTHAVPVDLERLAEFEESLPIAAVTEHGAIVRVLPIPSSVTQRDGAIELPDESQEWEHDSEERLAAFLARAPGRVWVEQYFEAMRILIEGLNVQAGNPHVVTSFRKHGFTIAVTINNRWVLQSWHDVGGERGRVGVGILQRAELAEAAGHVGAEVIDSYQYEPRAGDTENPPWMLAFADFAWLNDTRYLTEWLVASQGELYKARGSSNAASHSRVLFHAALDPAYRQHLFARVNWANA